MFLSFCLDVGFVFGMFYFVFVLFFVLFLVLLSVTMKNCLACNFSVF